MSTDKIESIPLRADLLLDSDTQPRKVYDEAKLQELAESIKSQGLLQPIVVRRIGLPAPPPTSYEIVFGHRRVRASRLAGLEFIPAIVRDMDDAQVATAQIHENLERDDVSPIEEAEGFDRLMREFGVTAKQLIADTGKSKSYIYGRLKLLQSSPDVRAAMADGLPTDVAIKISRLPTAALQAKALEEVRVTEWVDGQHVPAGWMSNRDGLDQLEDREFFIPIADASFDPEDSSLHPEGRTCLQCPHNSRNDAEAALAFSADTCTDVPCFELRTAAAKEREVEQHRAAGTLIEGEEAKRAGNLLYRPFWVPGDEGVIRLIERIAEDGTTVGVALGLMREQGLTPPTIYLLHRQHYSEPCIQRRDLPALWEGAGLPNPWKAKLAEIAAKATGGATGAGDDSESEDDADDSRQAALQLPMTAEEAAAYDNWPKIERAILKALAARPRTLDELRYVVAYEARCSDMAPDAAVEALGLTDEMERANEEAGLEAAEWLISKLPDLGGDQLAVLLLGYAIDYTLSTGGHRPTLAARVAMARAYGINPLDPAAPPAEPAPTPSTAARAQEKGARDVRYRNAATGETWSGRGQVPKWLRAKLDDGAQLSEFAVQPDLLRPSAGAAGESSQSMPADAGDASSLTPAAAGDACAEAETV